MAGKVLSLPFITDCQKIVIADYIYRFSVYFEYEKDHYLWNNMVVRRCDERNGRRL